MKSTFGLCIILLGVSFDLIAQDPVTTLKTSLQNLKSAIDSTDGVTASKHVDRQTKDYYGRILCITKKADSAKLAELPLIEILAVVYVRHAYSSKSILAMDPAALMQAELANGLIREMELHNLKIESAIMPSDSPRASARISQRYLDRQRRGKAFYMDFTLEDNVWKVNLPSVMAFADVILNEPNELKTLGVPRYIEYVITKLTNKPVASEIVWRRPGKN